MSTVLVWFRRDLRLGANPAWADATHRHERVLPVFVVDPQLWERCAPHRVALLAGHLNALDSVLGELGGRLHVVRGDPTEVVPSLARQHRAEEVVCNADVTPYAQVRDANVGDQLELVSHPGLYVHPPGSVRTTEDQIYRVFTPFHKRWSATEWEPWPEPGSAELTGDPGEGVPGADDPPMEPGEEAALDRLRGFCDRVDRYPDERDRPDLDSTSRLSIDLKYGTLSARTVISEVGTATKARRSFVRQVAWRDFYAQLMWAMPETVDRAMRPEYDRITWNDDPAGLAAWKEGRTGYPLVDAGMRQLTGEGWMHNRVRMITASFLCKDLGIDWRAGERWFRHWLLDGDVAQNVGNWQWIAGTGADAAPYFRIFNPVTQSKRFDPAGDYIRRWVPELAELEAPAIHAPWEAGPMELESAGVRLGDTYPEPILDHADAREETLARYQAALGG